MRKNAQGYLRESRLLEMTKRVREYAAAKMDARTTMPLMINLADARH